MQFVSREICVGFSTWAPVPKPRAIEGNEAKRASLWAQKQIDMARSAKAQSPGAPISLRSTYIDRNGVCRSVCTVY